LKALNDLEVHM